VLILRTNTDSVTNGNMLVMGGSGTGTLTAAELFDTITCACYADWKYEPLHDQRIRRCSTTGVAGSICSPRLQARCLPIGQHWL
jgi:hypothetical protein